MDIALIAIIVAAIAVVSVVAVSVIVRDRPGAQDSEFDHPLSSGPLDGLHDTIDGSIGMFLVRRIRRVPKTRPTEGAAMTAALTADEISYRIGVEGAPVPPEPETAAAGVSEPTDAAAAAALARAAAAGHAMSKDGGITAGTVVVPMGAVTPTGTAVAISPAPALPRRRHLREGAVALIGLAVIGVGGFFFWQSNPSGTDPAIALVSATTSPTLAATATPTSAPTATPRITPTPTPAATSTATPTASPTATPTPSPAPTPTPSPRPTPKPPPARSVATPRPTPQPTPTPTPKPTPKPTAKPTPKPTPAPPHAAIGTSCSGYGVAFNGSGSTGETSYVWDFDDGSTSTAANPSHTFSDARSYSVILTVKGPGGQDQAFKVVNVPC
ncbi:MAG: PKD domain-containing protein [Chloroflexota bacterium]